MKQTTKQFMKLLSKPTKYYIRHNNKVTKIEKCDIQNKSEIFEQNKLTGTIYSVDSFKKKRIFFKFKKGVCVEV